MLLLDEALLVVKEYGVVEQAISLEGSYGWHEDYTNAFVDSGDTVQVELSAVATSLKVENVNGTTADLQTPRFQVGQMLKLIEADDTYEFVLITAVTEDVDYTDELTIVRGVNGTVGIIHVVDRPIYIYRVPGNIVQMALRLVQWRYRQKDSDTFDKIYNLATQSVTTPSALPVDVERILGPRKFVL